MLYPIMQDVKPKRPYTSTRRRQQAADTRAAVLAAARHLFIETGWTATTIAGVARAAAVSSETIYAVFTSKQGLLAAVIETSIRRAEPDSPLVDQAGPRAVAAARDHHSQIGLFARDITEVLLAVAPLMAVVRTAAETDTSVATLYRTLHEGRRRNLAFVARALLANGPLRDEMTEAEATAVIWRLASPELFLLLTSIEGMAPDAYTEWLATTLQSALLDGPVAP